MHRLNRLLTVVSAIALALVTASCDNLAEPTQPRLAPTPMVVTSTSGSRLTVVYETNPDAGSVKATVGASGGLVGIGEHVLYVPEGTVQSNTEFSITRNAEFPLRVKLSAGPNNDVGRAGFVSPVYLALSLDGIAGYTPGGAAPTMIYFREDGLVEELETTIYEGFAIAPLDHFSFYGLAWP